MCGSFGYWNWQETSNTTTTATTHIMYRIIETISLSSFHCFAAPFHWINRIKYTGKYVLLQNRATNSYCAHPQPLTPLLRIFPFQKYSHFSLFLSKPWRRFNESFRPFFSCCRCCCCLLSLRYLSSGCLSIDDTLHLPFHICANNAGRFIPMILKMLTQTFQMYYKPMCITHTSMHTNSFPVFYQDIWLFTQRNE